MRNSYMTRNSCSSGQGRTRLLREFYITYSHGIVDDNIFDWNSRLDELRIKTHGGELGSPVLVEPVICPMKHTAMILSQIEWEMLSRKDWDHQ